MNYDAAIEKMVDDAAKRLGLMTGRPADRMRQAKRIVTELMENAKKIVREETLEFYEKKNKGETPETAAMASASPLSAEPTVPEPSAEAQPPVGAGGVNG